MVILTGTELLVFMGAIRMRGVLLHYNDGTQQGLIRAEDGNRYAFAGSEWRSDRRPVVGDEIDFEIQGTTASDIYVSKAAASGVDLTRLRESIAGSTRGFGDTAIGQRALGDWTLIIALIVLIGCFLPFLSFGRDSVSLFGVASGVGSVIETTIRLENLGALMTSSSRFKRPEPTRLSGVRWSLRLAYLLYLVPMLTLLLIALELLRRPSRRCLFWQGVTSVAMPIVVPLLMGFLIYSQLPTNLQQALARSGASAFDIGFMGIGFWVMVLAGIAQILNWMGKIKVAPRDLVGSRRSETS